LPLSLKGPENSERDFYEGVLSFTWYKRNKKIKPEIKSLKTTRSSTPLLEPFVLRPQLADCCRFYSLFSYFKGDQRVVRRDLRGLFIDTRNSSVIVNDINK
jgi:hypothetical protein